MTKLNNSHRRVIAEKLIADTFREREARLKQREHALALRVLRRELGEDALIRIAALPPGWLPKVDTFYLEDLNGLKRKTPYGYRSVSIHLDAPITVPYNWTSAIGRINVGPESLAEVTAFCNDETALMTEREQLTLAVKGSLAGSTTVEKLSADWPEAYAFFPHPELAPGALPAVRLTDLNARIAAARADVGEPTGEATSPLTTAASGQ